jgi:AbrB family looped-hinge helix DNA binding protein
LEAAMAEITKVTAKGQITIPIDVRRRLGLNKGDRMLFIEHENGFFIVNENRIDANAIAGARVKALPRKWSKDYIKAIKGFKATPDTEFIIPEDVPWSEREELL